MSTPDVSVSASTPAGEAAGRIILTKADPLFELEKDAAGGTDMDAIHDMRVASRRSREALRLFAPLYRKKTVAEWDGVFGGITKTLGRVRDADVYIDMMAGLASKSSDPEERTTLVYLIGYRQGKRADDLERMRKRLGRLGLAAARKRLEKDLLHPRKSADEKRPLGESARESVEARLTAVFSHMPDALTPERSDCQHAMRIDCKHLRYCMETLQPCFDERYEELHALLVGFQNELGELHDLDVFLDLTRDLREDADAKAAGISEAGIAAVLKDLQLRRDRQFKRFRRLALANPEEKLRRCLLDAVAWPPEGQPAETTAESPPPEEAAAPAGVAAPAGEPSPVTPAQTADDEPEPQPAKRTARIRVGNNPPGPGRRSGPPGPERP